MWKGLVLITDLSVDGYIIQGDMKFSLRRS